MTSKVLDLTTMGHALTELCNAFLGETEWTGINDEQREFLAWYAAHRDEITKLSDLEALASTSFAELNKFLEARGFNPMFQPFSAEDSIGVAAVLDMLVEWMIKGTPTPIRRYENSEYVNYPAFGISAAGAEIWDAAGYEHPLVRLRTKTGHGVWLMKANEPASGLDLNRQAQQLLTRTERRPSLRWRGVTVPMLEMDLKVDLSWMLGTEAISSIKGPYEISQAFQQFKLRANDIGARVKVATGFTIRATSAMAPPPPPYVFDDPFLGFFTQPGDETLPLAAFWADTDVWQNPGGTLEEL